MKQKDIITQYFLLESPASQSKKPTEIRPQTTQTKPKLELKTRLRYAVYLTLPHASFLISCPFYSSFRGNDSLRLLPYALSTLCLRTCICVSFLPPPKPSLPPSLPPVV